jgi:predicted glycosyltransferase
VALLDAVIDALALRSPGVPAVLVTGPMMAADEVGRLRERAMDLDVRVEEARADMDAVLGGARAVISMAGYCTVAEVLASGKPALLVPRTFPRVEQLNRARRWADRGRVEMIEPDALEPGLLADAVERLLERPPSPGEPLSGAADAARILAETSAMA